MMLMCTNIVPACIMHVRVHFDSEVCVCVCVCVCMYVCVQEEYEEWNRQLNAANAPRQPNILRFQHPGIETHQHA